MKSKRKVIFGAVGALVLGILLLPWLARRIDSTIWPVWERAEALEAQYRDMTNAYVIASEASREHPTYRIWTERRSALMKAGYIV